MPSDLEVTQLLRAVTAGEAGAQGRLLDLIYGDLRAIASSKMAKERSSHTLQPTALIHEAFPKVLGEVRIEWRDRKHFFGAAAEAMRRILVDHARARSRVKRGGDIGPTLELLDEDVAAYEAPEDLIALDAALREFEAIDETRAEVVKLKFFAGMTNPEIAELHQVSLRTIERHWTFARAWLRRAMG